MATLDELAQILYTRCAAHVVVTCGSCQRSYCPSELGRDLLKEGRPLVCPDCRVDLTEAVLGHLATCDAAQRKPPVKIERPGTDENPASSLGVG